MRAPGELAEIGRALVIARQLGEPWKVLERRYGNGRTWLWTLYRDALEQLGRELPSDERDRAKMFSEHLDACPSGGADQGLGSFGPVEEEGAAVDA